MRTCIRVSAIIIAILFSVNTYADHLSGKFLFAARMNGAQEVPAVSTNALGLATFYLNDERDTLCFEMTATNLSGPITGIHIHEASMGANGSVVVNMMPYMMGNHLKGTLTGTTLSSSFVEKLFAGQLYLNLHTSTNANGEIRGQILPEEDKGMVVMINGSNEVPAVSNSANAIGFFMLQKHMGKLSFNVVADGLSGPITGAHLHKAIAGQNGAVVENLTTYVSGNMISGSVDPSMYLDALMGDSLYINIHTTANPNGEIRGQLMVQSYLHFDAKLDTAQETMAVTGTGMEMGVAGLRLNYTFDTLWYDAQMNGLSGAITGAHFHMGGVNVGGNVVVAIPSGNINGNTISGIVTGAMLADTFIHAMLEGNIYLNVHTAANPNGEVRGQVYRTFREGYTYHINGAQESPMVTSDASGTGMVSIDRGQTGAHYMMVIDSLSGFSAAHFHNNIPGQNGGVMYTLTPNYANGGIFGYWLDTDANTPFTTASSNKFRKDSVYVNVHTMANANGEVRGNSSRKLCNEIPQSISNLGDVNITTKLYPNPAQTSTTLDIISNANTQTIIMVIDVMGRTIWSQDKKLVNGKNRVTIPLNNMAPGMYNLQIRNSTGQVSMKLMKN
ncbi:MAG: CHRD domain-containing protein [Chitinophagaceae bacterium]|nr:CHRD domain-containing protein [Chitinophagaceae bacterium]MCB9046380.1 CHRD domain-containing protein [Chitinophagales bacterium]